MTQHKNYIMVEVFKTNVENGLQALMMVERIHEIFLSYRANFDLDDCDKILRITSEGYINSQGIIELLKDFGFHASVLPDEVPADLLTSQHSI